MADRSDEQSHIVARADALFGSGQVLIAPAPETHLWRYLGFSRFAHAALSKSLYLAQLAVLQDQREGTIPKGTRAALEAAASLVHGGNQRGAEVIQNFSNQIEGMGRTLLYVSCWCGLPRELEVLWHRYGGAEPIALHTTAARLQTQLQENDRLVQVTYAEDEHYEVGVGSILNISSWKRREFEAEHEVRILRMGSFAHPRPGILLPFDFDQGLLEIVVGPSISPWLFDTASELVKRLGIRVPVRQSTLYSG